MTEKLLKFLLSELNVVRVICKNPACGVILEMPIGKIPEALKHGRCPACSFPFQMNPNSLIKLSEAIVSLTNDEDKVGIEFVLVDKG